MDNGRNGETATDCISVNRFAEMLSRPMTQSGG